MKLFYNNKEVYELQEWQKKVIQNDIPSSIFDNDMTRRCKYWLESPAEKYVHRHQKEMRQELQRSGERTIPTNLVKLGSKLVDKHTDLKTKDISSPVPCRVGGQSFELSVDHRKIMREQHKERYATMKDDEVAKDEEKICIERMKWILQHKFERCMERLRNDWTQRLASKGIEEVPSDNEAFANLVFSQPEYKDREARDAEERLAV